VVASDGMVRRRVALAVVDQPVKRVWCGAVDWAEAACEGGYVVVGERRGRVGQLT